MNTEIITDMKNSQNDAKALDCTKKDVKEVLEETVTSLLEGAPRVLWLSGEIEEEALEIAQDIMSWNLEDDGLPMWERKPIRLYIDSNGGLLETALTIVDTIRYSQTPVYCINMGRAFSAAALIYTAGHERMAMPGSKFLFHEGEGGTQGTYAQAIQQMGYYEHVIMQTKATMVANLDLEPELQQEFLAKMDRSEWYLYTTTLLDGEEDIVKYNLVTASSRYIFSSEKI